MFRMSVLTGMYGIWPKKNWMGINNCRLTSKWRWKSQQWVLYLSRTKDSRDVRDAKSLNKNRYVRCKFQKVFKFQISECLYGFDVHLARPHQPNPCCIDRNEHLYRLKIFVVSYRSRDKIMVISVEGWLLFYQKI